MSERLYCVLAPCIPLEVKRPEAYGGVSFATREAYDRHMERGHFIAAANAPEPYIVVRMNRYEEAS